MRSISSYGVGSLVELLSDDVFGGLESCVRFVFVWAVCHLKCPRLGVPMYCR